MFAVAESADAWARSALVGRATDAGGRSLRGASSVVGVIVVAAVAWYDSGRRRACRLDPGRSALDMPLSGKAAVRGEPVRNAVQLAIDDVNAAGGIGGSQLALDVRDDGAAPQSAQDPAAGVRNVTAMIADPKTIAVVGPWGSGVASKEIPVTNAPACSQCSPADDRSGADQAA